MNSSRRLNLRYIGPHNFPNIADKLSMNTRNVAGLISFFTLLLAGLIAQAVPGSLTYQGRIKDSSGNPLEYHNVQFEFTIMNPTGSCAIYREVSAGVDMRNSAGVFDVPIGIGTKNFPTGAGFKLLDSFDNSTSFTCATGGTYTPFEDDNRVLRVQFHDGTGWKLISPDNEIRTVPFASHAKNSQNSQKLGNHLPTDFALVSNFPLCGANQYLRHLAPAGTFECTTPVVSGADVSGNITGSAAGFTGNLSGDVSGTQSVTSVDRIKGVTVSMTGLGTGKVLKYNGSEWAPADDQNTAGTITALSGDVTSTGSPTATVTLSDAAVTSAKILDGTIVNADIAAGAAITDSKLATISTAGKVSGDAINSGTLGGSVAINTSGLLQTSNALRLYDGVNYVELKAPTGLATNVHLKLPASTGTPGQTLITDGNGLLSWHTSTTGTLTAVTATAPLVSTGGNTPVISLNNSGVTAGTHTKVTVNAQGLVTAGATLTNTDIPNLSGDVTSTAGSSATKVERIQGVAVSSTTPTTGQGFIYNGTSWSIQHIGLGQLRSTLTGNLQMPSACATADKTLTWSAITDTLVCTTISIANTQVTGLGTAATKNFGVAAGNLVELDAAGKVPTAFLPSTANNILNGGNSFGATTTIGTNDNNPLVFATNATPAMTLTGDGFLGIGTSSPLSSVDIVNNATGNNARDDLNIRTFDASNTPSVILLRARGTASVPAAVETGDGLGSLSFRAWNGTTWVSSSQVIASAEDNYTTAAKSNLQFWVTPVGEVMRINSAGNVGIGVTNPTAKLQVAGDTRFGCRAGFWGLSDGRICMEDTLRSETSVLVAVEMCRTRGPGSRLCTYTDFQQACGAQAQGIIPSNPFGGQVYGVYGDHTSLSAAHPKVVDGSYPAGHTDDVYLTWNNATCSSNADGNGRAILHDTTTFHYRCCY